MKTMKFVKGMGAGLMIGACLGMAFAPDKKYRKRQIGRAVRAFGQIIEDVSDAIHL